MTSSRCLITYQPISSGQYSPEGLRALSKKLTSLNHLPFTMEELHQQAQSRYDKMSIQGVQPKLSATLNLQKGRFDLVDTGGTFILKPSLSQYSEVPANEDLTMHMAAVVGLALPLNGKKNHLTSKDFIDYFAYERLSLNTQTIQSMLNMFQQKQAELIAWIDKSLLSEPMKTAYKALFTQRISIFFDHIN